MYNTIFYLECLHAILQLITFLSLILLNRVVQNGHAYEHMQKYHIDY